MSAALSPRLEVRAGHRWAVAGPAQWERVRASGHRAWPDGPGRNDDGGTTAWRSFPSRNDAERWARLRVVPVLGSARVLERNASGVVMEHARFEQGLLAADFDRAERAGGLRVPNGWRQYLQRPSWLAEGWLASGAFVRLYPPAEGVDLNRVWLEARGGGDLAHVVVVGSDGARENLVVDVRDADSPVFLLSGVCEGWQDAVEQAADTSAFIAAVEEGTFDFQLGDEDG